MQRRVLLILAGVLLFVSLAACGGGGSKSITDGYYEPEFSGGIYEGIKFDNGKVTFYMKGIPGEYAQAWDYTYTKHKDYGWVLNAEGSGVSNAQVEVVDNETLNFKGASGGIYKRFTGN